MHECPECGYACDCDGEDTWHDDVLDCACECWETEDTDDFPDEDNA